MPMIGRPTLNSENQFAQVSMANQGNQNRKGEDTGEALNKMVGYRSQGIFKDGKKHNQMGKDEFLKLLSHQLQHQDPMNPMDQSKMSSELAQFAQLEQLANLNSKFDKNFGDNTAETKFYAASFLGKKILTNGTSVKNEGDGKSSEIIFNLEKPAEKVTVKIFDEKNNLIGEIYQEKMNAGNQNLTWDGMALDGAPATKGDYSIQVVATDENFQPVKAETKASGIVTGVSFENGEMILTVDGAKKVFLRDVDKFESPERKITHSPLDGVNAYKQVSMDGVRE